MLKLFGFTFTICKINSFMVSALRVKPREIGLDAFMKHEGCRDLSLDKASMLLLVYRCGLKNSTLVERSRHRVMEGVCCKQCFFFFTSFLKNLFIYFYSVTIVCIFSPSLHPTPARTPL